MLQGRCCEDMDCHAPLLNHPPFRCALLGPSLHVPVATPCIAPQHGRDRTRSRVPCPPATWHLGV